MKCATHHKFLQSALFFMTTSLIKLYLCPSPDPFSLRYLVDSHTNQDPEEVCLLVHPWLSISLMGRASRLRPAGEELHRPTLFSASCCGPPYSWFFSFCISPLFHLSHSCWASGSQGPETAGRSLLSTSSAAFVAFTAAGTRECACVLTIIPKYCCYPFFSTFEMEQFVPISSDCWHLETDLCFTVNQARDWWWWSSGFQLPQLEVKLFQTLINWANADTFKEIII